MTKLKLVLEALWDQLPNELRRFNYRIEGSQIKILCETENQAQEIMRRTYSDLLDASRRLTFNEEIRSIVYGWQADPDGVEYPLTM